MAQRPATAAEWLAHAQDLHGRGLEAFDRLTAAGEIPVDTAVAHAAAVQALFAGARSAAAIAATYDDARKYG